MRNSKITQLNKKGAQAQRDAAPKEQPKTITQVNIWKDSNGNIYVTHAGDPAPRIEDALGLLEHARLEMRAQWTDMRRRAVEGAAAAAVAAASGKGN